MKQLYLLRHGERNAEGILTDRARQLAIALGKKLPKFAQVISSDSPRAIQTATLITSTDPQIDKRAGFYVPAKEKSREIYEFSISNGINFFEAAETYQNGKLAEGIRAKALGLNELIEITLSQLEENQAALIVSHDLTITTAMALKDIPKQSSDYLSGFIISNEGTVDKFFA